VREGGVEIFVGQGGRTLPRGRVVAR
jgi:hypothetical protein